MPFFDSEIDRAYHHGYALGTKEAHLKKVKLVEKFSNPDMQRAYQQGWEKGRQNKTLAENRRRSQAEWYQRNKERLNQEQRVRRRTEVSRQALAALPQLSSRISTAAAVSTGTTRKKATTTRHAAA